MPGGFASGFRLVPAMRLRHGTWVGLDVMVMGTEFSGRARGKDTARFLWEDMGHSSLLIAM